MRKVQYIATVDDSGVNPDGTNPYEGPLLLDAIPVSALERISLVAAHRPNQEVVEHLDYLLMQVPSGRLRHAPNEANGWFRVQVSEEATGAEGEFQVSAPNVGAAEDRGELPLWISVLENPVSDGHADVLDSLVSLTGYEDASEDAIEDVLGFEYLGYEGSLAIAVYDVGQGNFNAIVDEYEHPLMFFDLGWHIPLTSISKPLTTAFDPFSALRDDEATVVLSHIDLDHWLYAVESGRAILHPSKQYWCTQPIYRQRALERPWVLRRPKQTAHALGGSHLHFLYTLGSSTFSGSTPSLHIWPEQLPWITVGPITVFRCDPSSSKSKPNPKYLRNNESLGMRVEHGTARVLLCGDADYPSIPDTFKDGLTGMVAPHHGGAVTPGSMPNSVGHGRLVLSTYENAYPSMPDSSVLKDARRMGWKIARTDERISCKRCHVDHGHRLIRLNQTPRCTCGDVDSGQLCIAKD